jgi:sigma-54 specific flagellar transcriptional regulator A
LEVTTLDSSLCISALDDPSEAIDVEEQAVLSDETALTVLETGELEPLVGDDLAAPAGAAITSLATLPEEGLDLRAHLLAIERQLIEQALQRSNGTVAHAARLLNLRRTTLVEKMRKLDMESTAGEYAPED